MKKLALMEEAEAAQSSGGGAVEAKNEIPDTGGDTAGHPPGAHLDAPAAAMSQGTAEEPAKAAVDAEDELAVARAAGAPRVAIIAKGNERIPVQLRDKAHLDELQREHGETAVEVQS